MIDYYVDIESVDEGEIYKLLFQYDSYFIPKISERTNLEEYAKKLSSNATFILAKNKNIILGFAAIYYNPAPQSTYLPLISVNHDCQGLGVGRMLMVKIINYCNVNNSAGILLEMRADNLKLFKFYSDFGFKIRDTFVSPSNGETKYHMFLSTTRITNNE